MYEYDLILEELNERVACGELTLEEAELINDYAYEDYVLEGANNEYRKYFKKTKKDFKMSSKRIKQYIDNDELEKAKKEIADMIKLIEYNKKWVMNNIDSLPEKFIGSLFELVIFVGKGVLYSLTALVPIVGPLASAILKLKKVINTAMAILQGESAFHKEYIKNADEIDSTHTFNMYKTVIVGNFTEYQRKLKLMEQKIDKAIAQQKRTKSILKESVLSDYSSLLY